MEKKKAQAGKNVPLRIEFINNNKGDLSGILGRIFGQEIVKKQSKNSLKK